VAVFSAKLKVLKLFPKVFPRRDGKMSYRDAVMEASGHRISSSASFQWPRRRLRAAAPAPRCTSCWSVSVVHTNVYANALRAAGEKPGSHGSAAARETHRPLPVPRTAPSILGETGEPTLGWKEGSGAIPE
jgi:hypothetical protein